MTEKPRFSTALRHHVRQKIEQLRHADIVIGIPSYQSGAAIVHVVKTVMLGLDRIFPNTKSLVVVSDGGSTDDTRDFARGIESKSFNVQKIVTVYRGIPGKGSGLRAVFEVAAFMKARATAVFDSDLISITPEWVRNVITPVFDGYDFVAPDYRRFKLDGTITNTIAYNLTRALYGRRVRQPIGGDFGLSQALVKHYLDQDAWETDVARFGIDIWMTTMAILGQFRICQTPLGSKIHGQKDPSEDLGPMFRQVVGTVFQLMEQHAPFWLAVQGSTDVPVLGEEIRQDPVAFPIDQENLVEYFRVGYQNFSGVWEKVVAPEDLAVVADLARTTSREAFHLPVETWVRICYRYACFFSQTPRQRMKVLDTLIPLYYGRVASLINDLADKTDAEAEAHFEYQASVFETLKPYLVEHWQARNP